MAEANNIYNYQFLGSDVVYLGIRWRTDSLPLSHTGKWSQYHIFVCEDVTADERVRQYIEVALCGTRIRKNSREFWPSQFTTDNIAVIPFLLLDDGTQCKICYEIFSGIKLDAPDKKEGEPKPDWLEKAAQTAEENS